jgi:hypothetical protein
MPADASTHEILMGGRQPKVPLSGFGGVASDPQSITVRYGHPWTAAEVDVTTYPSDPLDDLAHLADAQAGWEWWAMTNRRA